MLSPAKMITAAALALAIGSVMLVAQPFDRGSVSVPGAEAEAVEPTWITGNVYYAPACSSPDIEVDSAVQRHRTYECSPQRWVISDERLSGEVAARWNDDVYRTDDGFFSISTSESYVRNEGGSWVCASTNLQQGFGLFPDYLTEATLLCTGAGGYEGISAVLIIDYADSDHPVVGFIFAGDPPPLPGPPDAA